MLEFKENLSPTQSHICTINLLEKKAKELEEENLNIKKDMKRKENEFCNSKIVLEQKNELLKKEVEEYKLRENNFKIFNENIFALLNDLSSDKRLPNKDLIEKLEIHAQDMQDQKRRNNEVLKVLEEENRKLREEIKKKESELKDSALIKENVCSNFEVKLKDLMKENSQLKKEKSFFEEEMRRFKSEGNFDKEKKNQEFRMVVENLKKTHLEEIIQLERALNEEKEDLNNKIFLLQNELTKNEGENLNLMKKEVLRLNKTINDLKKTHAEEILTNKRKFEEIKKKNESLETTIKKMKISLQSSSTMNENNNKVLKEKVNLIKELVEQKEKLQENEKKNLQKIKELKKQIKNYENKTDASLNESKVIHNTSRKDILNVTHNECRSKSNTPIRNPKSIQKNENKDKKASVLKNKTSSNSNFDDSLTSRYYSKIEISPITHTHNPSTITTNNETFESIPNSYADYLSNKVETTDRIEKKPIKIINFYGPPNSNSYISSRSEDEDKITNNYESFLKTLNNPKTYSKSRYASNNQQDLQDLIENPLEESKSSFKNRSCSQTNLLNFIAKNENNVNVKKDSVILEENEECTKKTVLQMENLEENKLNIFTNTDEFNECNNDDFMTFSKIQRTLFQTQNENSHFDCKLREETSDNSSLQKKNKKLEKELESVILELKQVKMEWALTEERKEETEVKLKNEIKYLLNKLLEAKNKPNDDHSRNLSLNISGIKDNLKESILSRTSRSRSPSIYKPPSGIKTQRNFTLTPKIQDINKTEEFEDECENQKKCSNTSFTVIKTMRDLNKHL